MTGSTPEGEARPEGDALDDVFDEETSTEQPAVVLPPGLPPAVAAALASHPIDDADDDAEESLPDAGPNMMELLGLDNKFKPREWRRLPRSIRLAITIVWRATRWRGGTVAMLQAIGGIGLGAQLLAGNSLLTRALALRQSGGELRTLAPQAVAVGAIAAVLAVVQHAATAQQRVVAELVGTHAYGEIMKAAAAADLVQFEDPNYYDRLQRASVGGQMRPYQLVQGLLQLLSGALGALGISVALFTLQPVLVSLAVVAAVPVWLATIKNARAQFAVFMGAMPDERERGYLRSLLTERDAAKEVRAFNLIGYLSRRHDVVSARVLARISKEAWQNMRRSLLGQAGAGAATLLGSGALLWMLVTNRLPIAAAVTAALAMQQLRSRVTGSAVSLGMVFESALYLDDYAAFVEAAEPIREEPTETVAPFRRLAAHGVTFAYPGSPRPALADVDVDVKAGEVVALVGENGSGKTTLAKLLCGLYAPTEGRITWDDTDIGALDPLAIREHMTVIFQDFIRYALPARDNVGLGRHQLLGDEDAIRQAIRTAGLSSVFNRLPEGWDTVLGRQFTGGQDLSGGQWQRVALARAFFRDAAFLVLDEPTASLDARAEHRLFERLRELAAGRSVLLITHRFGNVRMADRIYVLHQGKVVEHGSHNELMVLDGRYAELFGLQASQYLKDQSTTRM